MFDRKMPKEIWYGACFSFYLIVVGDVIFLWDVGIEMPLISFLCLIAFTSYQSISTPPVIEIDWLKTLKLVPAGKTGGHFGLHILSVCHSVTLIFQIFLGSAFIYLNDCWSSLTFTVNFFFMSYCPVFKISFPDFSWICFYKPGWKLLASFHIKSYRSSLTFVTIDLLFMSYCFLFSGLFFAMLSHIWMKVGSKPPYGELQIKFHFRHCWPTFE